MKKKKIILILGSLVALFLILIGIYQLFIVGGKLIKVEAAPEYGFNYEYYAYIPYGVSKEEIKYILVEPNNGGRVSDNHQDHVDDALNLVKHGMCNRLARSLKTVLLVPVFDRPESNWQMYTHSLDRDTLLNKDGKLARIDLQLISMIEHLRTKLREDNIVVNDKVLMNGFSASGSFVNRFTALHPQLVQAVAAGGVNCMPILPTEHWDTMDLIYPIGVSDISEIADIEFNINDYKAVPQYIYMGSKDDNDTLPYDDAFGEKERQLIIDLLGSDMRERWDKSKDIYKQLDISAEMVMYDGVGHMATDKIIDDIISFFQKTQNRA
jgi:hypothetical protein